MAARPSRLVKGFALHPSHHTPCGTNLIRIEPLNLRGVPCRAGSALILSPCSCADNGDAQASMSLPVGHSSATTSSTTASISGGARLTTATIGINPRAASGRASTPAAPATAAHSTLPHGPTATLPSTRRHTQQQQPSFTGPSQTPVPYPNSSAAAAAAAAVNLPPSGGLSMHPDFDPHSHLNGRASESPLDESRQQLGWQYRSPEQRYTPPSPPSSSSASSAASYGSTSRRCSRSSNGPNRRVSSRTFNIPTPYGTSTSPSPPPHHRQDQLLTKVLATTNWYELRAVLLSGAADTAPFADRPDAVLAVLRHLASVARYEMRGPEASALRGFLQRWLLQHSASLRLMSPTELSLCLHALAKLARVMPAPPTAWITAWFAAAQPFLLAFAFRPKDLSLSLWALSRLELRLPPAATQLLLAAAEPHLPTFNGQDLSLVALSLAALTAPRGGESTAASAAAPELLPGPSWQSAFLRRCRYVLPGCGVQALANLAHGLVRSGMHVPEEVMRALCTALYGQLPAASPQALANVLSALAARVFVPEEGWWGRFLEESAARMAVGAGVVSSGSGSNRWNGGGEGGGGYDRSSGSTGRCAAGQWCNVEDLTHMAAAAAELSLVPPRWWTVRLYDAMERQVPYANARQLAQLLHAVAQLHNSMLDQHRRGAVAAAAAPPPLSTAAGDGEGRHSITAASPPPQPSASPVSPPPLGDPGCRPPRSLLAAWQAASATALPSFNALDAAHSLWALTSLGEQPPHNWIQHLIAVIRPLLPTASPTTRVLLLWSLSALGFRPSWCWLAEALAATGPSLPYMGPQDFAMLTGAVVRLSNGRPPPGGREWSAGLLAAVGAQVGIMPDRCLANTVWGLYRLRVQPPPEWLDQLAGELRRRWRRAAAAAASSGKVTAVAAAAMVAAAQEPGQLGKRSQGAGASAPGQGTALRRGAAAPVAVASGGEVSGGGGGRDCGELRYWVLLMWVVSQWLGEQVQGTVQRRGGGARRAARRRRGWLRGPTGSAPEAASRLAGLDPGSDLDSDASDDPASASAADVAAAEAPGQGSGGVRLALHRFSNGAGGSGGLSRPRSVQRLPDRLWSPSPESAVATARDSHAPEGSSAANDPTDRSVASDAGAAALSHGVVLPVLLLPPTRPTATASTNNHPSADVAPTTSTSSGVISSLATPLALAPIDSTLPIASTPVATCEGNTEATGGVSSALAPAAATAALRRCSLSARRLRRRCAVRPGNLVSSLGGDLSAAAALRRRLADRLWGPFMDATMGHLATQTRGQDDDGISLMTSPHSSTSGATGTTNATTSTTSTSTASPRDLVMLMTAVRMCRSSVRHAAQRRPGWVTALVHCTISVLYELTATGLHQVLGGVLALGMPVTREWATACGSVAAGHLQGPMTAAAKVALLRRLCSLRVIEGPDGKLQSSSLAPHGTAHGQPQQRRHPVLQQHEERHAVIGAADAARGSSPPLGASLQPTAVCSPVEQLRPAPAPAEWREVLLEGVLHSFRQASITTEARVGLQAELLRARIRLRKLGQQAPHKGSHVGMFAAAAATATGSVTAAPGRHHVAAACGIVAEVAANATATQGKTEALVTAADQVRAVVVAAAAAVAQPPPSAPLSSGRRWCRPLPRLPVISRTQKIWIRARARRAAAAHVAESSPVLIAQLMTLTTQHLPPLPPLPPTVLPPPAPQSQPSTPYPLLPLSSSDWPTHCASSGGIVPQPPANTAATDAAIAARNAASTTLAVPELTHVSPPQQFLPCSPAAAACTALTTAAPPPAPWLPSRESLLWLAAATERCWWGMLPCHRATVSRSWGRILSWLASGRVGLGEAVEEEEQVDDLAEEVRSRLPSQVQLVVAGERTRRERRREVTRGRRASGADASSERLHVECDVKSVGAFVTSRPGG